MSEKFAYSFVNNFPDGIYLHYKYLVIKSPKLNRRLIEEFLVRLNIIGFVHWFDEIYTNYSPMHNSSKVNNVYIFDADVNNLEMDNVREVAEKVFKDLNTYRVVPSQYSNEDLMKTIPNISFALCKRDRWNKMIPVTLHDCLFERPKSKMMVVVKGKTFNNGFTLYIKSEGGRVHTALNLSKPYKYFDNFDELKWLFTVLEFSSRIRAITFKATLFDRIKLFFKRLIKV